MSHPLPRHMAIRQAPGWWPSLIRAECDSCDWVGPTRDASTMFGQSVVRRDALEHRCADEA